MRIDRSYLGNQNTYAENNPKCIVVHNTDNFAAGADARAHARAQHDGNFQNISAHYYVDDGDTAYQAAPHSRGCWHVGINYGGKNLFQQYGNKNSIGVEMCVQAGYNYEKAFENTAALVREIMRDNKHTKIVAIPNFLEHYPETVPERREKTILAVGRLVDVKGMDRLIRIFAAVHEKAPDWSLRIAGEGEERPALEALIEKLGLSGCVTLMGMLTADEVEREMLSAAIYASTSKSEGLSFALVEAMSCGMAPVAFDVRVGPGATITDGVNGYLVPDGDEAAFAERLLALINSPELMAELRANAERRAQDFSRENVSRQWLNLLEDK